MNKTKSLIYLSIIGMALITTPILHNGGSDIDKPEFAVPGMVAYAASYSSNPENEPQYSTQNSKTFQYLNLGQTHDYYRGDSVKVGIIDDDKAEVIEGLRPGEIFVCKGTEFVRGGSAVNPNFVGETK